MLSEKAAADHGAKVGSRPSANPASACTAKRRDRGRSRIACDIARNALLGDGLDDELLDERVYSVRGDGSRHGALQTVTVTA